MEFNQKQRRYLALLLVLIIVLQLVPGIFTRIECCNNHIEKPLIVSSINTDQTDIILTTDSRKTAFQYMSSDKYKNSADHISYTEVSVSKHLSHMVFVDERREIEQTIPNYFHGSKYKEDSLVI